MNDEVNRIYTMMLTVLAAFLLLAIGQMFYLRHLVGTAPRAQLVLDYLKVVFAVYFVAIVLTLALRAKKSPAGRIAAGALNLALLPVIPLGTVVGLFGLIKLDK